MCYLVFQSSLVLFSQYLPISEGPFLSATVNENNKQLTPVLPSRVIMVLLDTAQVLLCFVYQFNKDFYLLFSWHSVFL